MEVECSHARVRSIQKLVVPTPLIAPSFSSRGFPRVSDIWQEFRHKLYGVCLVSTFDIAGERIPADVTEMVDVAIIDSGMYEVNAEWIESGELHYSTSEVNWTRDQYRECVSGLGRQGNAILVNFDHFGSFEEQIRKGLEDFSLLSHAASDFLIKPTGPSDWINLPKLNQHSEELKQFDIIGITAKDAGDSFLQKCSTVVMLRDSLDEAKLDMPIHVFGAISPFEVLTYFFCGADVFDGLNWLRLSFRTNGSAPIEESAMIDLNWNLTHLDLLTGEWTQNLKFLYRLQEAMQGYAAHGDLESLVEQFPIARQSARIAEIAGAEIRH